MYFYLQLNFEKNEDKDKKRMKEKRNKVKNEDKPGVFPLKYNGIFATHCKYICSELRFRYRIFLRLKIITVSQLT
jgi:hypothetical protein